MGKNDKDNMTKPKYNVEEAKRTLCNLTQENAMAYEELMKKHGNILMWASYKLKDEQLQKQLREIKRRCLIVSLRALSNEEQLNLGYIQDKHPGLESIAKQIYSRNNGKSPWQLAVEDAGLKYPCKPQKQWNLKEILSEISSLEEEIMKIGEKGICRINPSLVQASKRYIRSFGRACLLAGIDFLKKEKVLINPRVQNEYYRFTADELRKIWKDKSLSEEEKARCLFNALSLQFYLQEKYRFKRRLDDGRKGFETCQQNSYFHGKLENILEQCKEDLSSFRVSLILENISNRFYNARFYFSGEESGSNACKFYHEINDTLRAILQ